MTAETTPAERLDQYVSKHLPSLSRSSGARLIEQGRVLVNGQAQTKAGYRLRAADKVEIQYDEAELTRIPEINLPVIYEDEKCVVINKPLGLLSHSKGAFNPEATVATWLSGRLKGGSGGSRDGIVHRLDRATSGVMMCAKTPAALSHLQKQFSLRKTKKTYAAVVSGGALEPARALIDMPIERNPKKPQTFRVGSNGKPSITEYKVLKTNGQLSLLELKPTTGRTHQLRVHLEHLGHPILGDTLYGGQLAQRLFLHAKSLEITLPGGERRIFEAPVPPEFEEALVT
ncbi:MAG TPA: RluA family pseudouridine synthase [Candidatus Dormibacteraeota bacterium]|nr:RluA family pseudouridine synthase [Candidatus Dormibacteraeota bacterium]